jgi:DNA modification methylase
VNILDNLKTIHKIYNKNSQNMDEIEDNSINLVITSPPYPMIQMWDEIFSEMNQEIKKSLQNNNPDKAYELMHKELDKVWKECIRVLKPGGFICINIGDATRTFEDKFKLYPNHSRIIQFFLNNNIDLLPTIYWRKSTNSPNKFMGSGMLPGGAYVTLENEHILIFRKNGKRKFSEDEKINRRESAYFWEERNLWFSDLWRITGVKQEFKLYDMKKVRKRTAAYPFELPYMYSIKNDWILDPFLGTGTTTISAIASQRNSVGYEMDSMYSNYAKKEILNLKENINHIILTRYKNHNEFIKNREERDKKIKYYNQFLKTKVITKQEINLKFSVVTEINEKNKNTTQVNYEYFEPDKKMDFFIKNESNRSKTLKLLQ